MKIPRPPSNNSQPQVLPYQVLPQPEPSPDPARWRRQVWCLPWRPATPHWWCHPGCPLARHIHGLDLGFTEGEDPTSYPTLKPHTPKKKHWQSQKCPEKSETRVEDAIDYGRQNVSTSSRNSKLWYGLLRALLGPNIFIWFISSRRQVPAPPRPAWFVLHFKSPLLPQHFTPFPSPSKMSFW